MELLQHCTFHTSQWFLRSDTNKDSPVQHNPSPTNPQKQSSALLLHRTFTQSTSSWLLHYGTLAAWDHTIAAAAADPDN
jgi:hypothetical protein